MDGAYLKGKILASLWDFGPFHPGMEREGYPKTTNPAKMRPALARAILQIYGEAPVLDPMAGSFTTCFEASKLGMESYGVEYEAKFVKEAAKFEPKAPIHFVRGDARALSEIFAKGFGSIVLSPPYSEGIGHAAGKNASPHPWRLGFQRAMTEVWSEGNIAKLKHGLFNSIVFSPPYGEASRGGAIAKRGYEGKHGMDPGLKDRCDRPISDDPRNIGNTHGKTYLSEMAKVYSECFKVLKPGKFMVVVVKDIRKDGFTIPLSADTIKLCQSVGFQCYEVIVNRLNLLSFWMLHHAKRAQDLGEPKALKNHEYVIVMQKPR